MDAEYQPDTLREAHHNVIQPRVDTDNGESIPLDEYGGFDPDDWLQLAKKRAEREEVMNLPFKTKKFGLKMMNF